jgi:predicted GH43/DUF377 family glycosyl hydrolase
MRSRPALFLLVMLAGCAAQGDPSASEPEASASVQEGSAVPSATPAPGAPTLAFTWPDGEAPAVTREQVGMGESYINPGAVIEHDGTLHMFANLFTAWPGTVKVPHLTSVDGSTWELASDEPVMTSEDVPFTPSGHDVSSGFVTDDGTWVLVFTTVSGSEPWVIGLATAPAPEGPWTVLPEPVLTADGLEDADGGLTWPSVVRTDDGYAMYFTIASGPHRGGPIGMATSTDGLTWTRRDEPVLTAILESWELTALDRPRVARVDDGRYVMLYAGRTLTDRGVAWSDDGVTWTRDGEAPAVSKDMYPVPGDAWDAALVHRDGVLSYYLEIGFATSTGTEIYRATAPVP